MENTFSFNSDGWIHLVSLGEHAWKSPDGKQKILQVIDQDALVSMCNHFNSEMLVDYDHESHDPSKRTTAAGWITAVEIRSDGLWGKVRWSEHGAEDVTGGNYRFVSPTFDRNDCVTLGTRDGAEVVRPLRLTDAALTNKPNLTGMVPLTNRASNFSNVVALNPQPKEISMIDMDLVLSSLLPLLTLPEGVTPENVTTEQILDALKKLPHLQDQQELHEKTAVLERELVNRILDEYTVTGDAREPWQELLLANREQGVRALALSRSAVRKESKAFQPLHNRSSSRVPAHSFIASSRSRQQREAIRNYQEKNHCTFRNAFNAIQKLNPELFSEIL